MIGESGSHSIEVGRVPVAPIYFSLPRKTSGLTDMGPTSEIVPPFFAGRAPRAGTGQELPGLTSWGPGREGVEPVHAEERVAAEDIGAAEELPEIEGTAEAGDLEDIVVPARSEDTLEVAEGAVPVDLESGDSYPEVSEPENLSAEIDTTTGAGPAAGPGRAELGPIDPVVAGEPVALTERAEVSGTEREVPSEGDEGMAASALSSIQSAVVAGSEPRGLEVSRVESGLSAPVSAEAYELAERLESIADRLRTDGTAAVVAGMRGDRLDALLAGVFAGYLAAREADS